MGGSSVLMAPPVVTCTCDMARQRICWLFCGGAVLTQAISSPLMDHRYRYVPEQDAMSPCHKETKNVYVNILMGRNILRLEYVFPF